MLIFSKNFSLHSDYLNYKNSQNYVLPNVSHCEDENKMHYEMPAHNYANDYLTFEAIEDSIFTINITKTGSGQTLNYDSISYSVDNGSTWTTTQITSDIVITTPTVHAGSKILFKGIGTTLYLYGVGLTIPSSTGNFNISGNIMSLLYGDDFANNSSILTASMNGLFKNNTKIVSAEHLILPNEISTNNSNCYVNMFSGCTSLTIAPKLPATTLTYGCYNSMFSGCTSLTAAPELPATELAGQCYFQMFSNCTSLTYIKAMFTTTPSSYYTLNWVNGVSSTGTFVKNSNAEWELSGADGIPIGWNIEYA